MPHDGHTDRVDLTEPIGVLRLPLRTVNALRAARVWTLGQLVGLTARQVLPSRGIGRQAIGEIERALSEHGLLGELRTEKASSQKSGALRVTRAVESGVGERDKSAGSGFARRTSAGPQTFSKTQEDGARQHTPGRRQEAASDAEGGVRGMRVRDPQKSHPGRIEAQPNLLAPA